MPRSLYLGVCWFSAWLAIAWLLPNHYPPWLAFHSDFISALAAAGVVLTAVMISRSIELARPALIVALVALVPLVQGLLGLQYFGGDAIMACLYLLGLALTIQVGDTAGRLSLQQSVEPLVWALVGAGLVSTTIACLQWVGVGKSIFIMDFRPGGRPYANFAQPNQLATMLMMAVPGTFLLQYWKRIGLVACSMIVLFLLGGTALTQSRTGWLEVAMLVTWLVILKRQTALPVPKALLLGAVLVFAVFVIAVPHATRLLDLAPSARTSDEQASAGTRPVHWRSAISALGQQPITGYGWNQTSVALSRVAANMPMTGELIEHSHNLLLDLLLWNGVPMGIVIIAAGAYWLIDRGRRAVAPETVLLMGCVLMPLIHSMTEFPLEYAYVLLPVGYLAGVIESQVSHRSTLSAPRWAVVGIAGVGMVTTVSIAGEYLQLEEHHRDRRFAAASIGHGLGNSRPTVTVLTQLDAFVNFADTQPTSGMSAEQLRKLQKVAERYGQPGVLFRYAIAMGINNRVDEATTALTRLCKQHPVDQCKQARVEWKTQQNQQPLLRAISFPVP